MSVFDDIKTYQEARETLLGLRASLRAEVEELQRRTEALLPLQQRVRMAHRNFKSAQDKLAQAIHADASGILGSRDQLSEAFEHVQEPDDTPTSSVARFTDGTIPNRET
jgi:cell division septum initiation protein DivIVA